MSGAFQCSPTDSAIPEGEQSYENTPNAAGLVHCGELSDILSFTCLSQHVFLRIDRRRLQE